MSSGAVRTAPEDMLVLETDAPYLEPEPRSLKRNEPSLLTRVIARLCDLRGWTPEQAVEITRRNSRDLFRFAV
jgi:TatD DNase family protein